MFLIIFLFLLTSFFAYSGFSNYFFPNKKQSYFNDLKNFKSGVNDIVFKNKYDTDSLALREIKKLIISKSHDITMIAPVDGYVTQGIQISKNHNGIDIVSKKGKGDNIKAVQDGVVIFADDYGDLGRTIIISHQHDYFTMYSHCDSLFVNERDIVSSGSIIATLGETGKTTAPHLHFEIWRNDTIIDPRNIIKKYGELDVSAE